MPDGRGRLASASHETTAGVWIQPLDGVARRVGLGDLVLTGGFGADIEATSTGALVFIATKTDRPSELYVMDSPTAAPRRLTDFNAWAGQVAFGRTERVTWKTEEFEADGVVTYPPGFDPSRKYPLTLLIHGGPTASSKRAFSALPQVMAGFGMVVFEPNYRGSDNLGNAFQSAIRLDAGGVGGRCGASLPGGTVVQMDGRAGHRLVTPTGRVVLVGWPWACGGASWADTVALLVNGNLHGGHDVDRAERYSAAGSDWRNRISPNGSQASGEMGLRI